MGRKDAASTLFNVKSFELRWRLVASGALEKYESDPCTLFEAVTKLQRKSGDANATLELNTIGADYGLDLGYRRLEPGRTLVYSVVIKLDGGIRYLPPVEQGMTVAHRRLRNKLLRVRFEEVPKGADAAARAARDERRRAIFANGFSLPLVMRDYAHLCHKDPDKKEEETRLWFVALQSAAGERYSPSLTPALGREADVQGYRNQLLDSAGVGLSTAKLAARLSLAFSQTVSVDACRPTTLVDRRNHAAGLEGLTPGPGEVMLVLVDDIRGDALPNNRRAVMSDGAGRISHSLTQHIPECLSGRQVAPAADGRAPLLSQVRVWHEGYVAKGMLMADATLPDGLIVLRDSMVKVNPRLGFCLTKPRNGVPESSAFEVCRTSSERTVEARLTPQLVPLLEFGGGEESVMVPLLLKLLDEHLQKLLELQAGTLTPPQLRRLLAEIGPVPTAEPGCSAGPAAGPVELLCAGFSAATEPWLRSKVAKAVQAAMEKLALGKAAIRGSLYALGVPDPTCTLAPGEVVVVEDGKFLDEDVLCYRSPGTHAGDIQRAIAVLPPDALRDTLQGAACQNAVIFSTRGTRAMGDMLSGGDYDGDEYVIIRGLVKFEVSVPAKVAEAEARPRLVSLVDAFTRSSKPYENCSAESSIVHSGGKPNLADPVQASEALLEHFFKCDAASGKLGQIANLLERAQEEWGVNAIKCEKLVDHYMAATDASKSGLEVSEHWKSTEKSLDRVTCGVWPAHMRDKALKRSAEVASEPSSSARGRMWARAMPIAEKSGSAAPSGGGLDNDLRCPLESCKFCGEQFSEAAIGAHQTLCEEVQQLRQLTGDFSTPTRKDAHNEYYHKWSELYSEYKEEMHQLGAAPGVAGAKPGAKSLASCEWGTRYDAIIRKYQRALEAGRTEAELAGRCDTLLCEAAALYMVVYQAAARFDGDPPLSFAWKVAGKYLCELKWRREEARAAAEGRSLRCASCFAGTLLAVGSKRKRTSDEL